MLPMVRINHVRRTPTECLTMMLTGLKEVQRAKIITFGEGQNQAKSRTIRANEKAPCLTSLQVSRKDGLVIPL